MRRSEVIVRSLLGGLDGGATYDNGEPECCCPRSEGDRNCQAEQRIEGDDTEDRAGDDHADDEENEEKGDRVFHDVLRCWGWFDLTVVI